ncbi:MAG: hypothetical protein ACP5O2_07780 [Bacteroidales bacterium]
MKEINENNIEAWFLDYFEGRLNEEEKQALWDYLKNHPEFFAKFREDSLFMYKLNEFKASKETKFPAESKNFLSTSENRLLNFRNDTVTSFQYVSAGLKHRIFESLYFKNQKDWETQCIAYLEGDLENEKRKEFEEMVKVFPHLNQDLKLYKQAFFEPEPIKFPHIESLYRKNNTFVYRIGVIATAAAIALFILFYPIRVKHSVIKPPASSEFAAVTPSTPKNDKKASPSVETTAQLQINANHLSKSKQVPDLERNVRIVETLTPLPLIDSKTLVELNVEPVEIQPINRIYTAIYAGMIERWQADAMRENRSIVSALVKPVRALLGKANENLPGHNPINIWTLAEFTIKGFNTMTNNDLELKALRDEQGRFKALAFGNENFKIAHIKKDIELSPSENSPQLKNETTEPKHLK